MPATIPEPFLRSACPLVPPQKRSGEEERGNEQFLCWMNPPKQNKKSAKQRGGLVIPASGECHFQSNDTMKSKAKESQCRRFVCLAKCWQNKKVGTKDREQSATIPAVGL